MAAVGHRLSCHPRTPDAVLRAVEVAITRSAGRWHFVYRLSGDIDRLQLPSPQAPAAADGLWQHTCCEAFVGVAGESAYREFNFSPSRQWAAYAFTTTRQRDSAWCPPAAPVIACRREGDTFIVDAALDAELDTALDAALLPSASACEIGLAVVSEAADGTLAYWALAHPSPQPDFHHRAAFALSSAALQDNTA